MLSQSIGAAAHLLMDTILERARNAVYTLVALHASDDGRTLYEPPGIWTDE